MSPLTQTLNDYVAENYPHFTPGIREAQAVSHDFEPVSETLLSWAQIVLGPQAIPRAVDAFVQFTTEVNLAQVRYEQTGQFEHQSFQEVYAQHYSQTDQMEGYLWGVYLTNFLWAHHVEIWQHFYERFVVRLACECELVEIAPGHGSWGAWVLSLLPDARLRGFDISPAAIQIAAAVAEAAGVAERASYKQTDALDLDRLERASADACLCFFLAEHLEDPQKLFSVVEHLLRPGGRAYITGTLTAAQLDHIYEFRRESELVIMAENAGLRALETFSANPRRVLPKARFVPRSMALILEKSLTSMV